MKHLHNTALTYGLGALTTLVIIAVIVIAAVFDMNRTSPIASTSRSMFTFTEAPLWAQGPTGRKSMTLFHDSHACFILINYKPGHVSVADNLRKVHKNLVHDGYTVTTGSIKTLAIQTSAGKRSFKLHQLSVSANSGSQKMKVAGGQELGFIQLHKGYIKIEGYCDSAAQLPATIPALQAIQFHNS